MLLLFTCKICNNNFKKKQSLEIPTESTQIKVGSQGNPCDIERKYKSEVAFFSGYSQFGKTKSAETMIRYLGSDLTLIDENKMLKQQ